MEAIVNSPLDVVVFKVQNRSIIHQRKHRSGDFEIRVGCRIHYGGCDSAYRNSGEPCDRNQLLQTQYASRCALFRVPESGASER